MGKRVGSGLVEMWAMGVGGIAGGGGDGGGGRMLLLLWLLLLLLLLLCGDFISDIGLGD